MNVKELMYQNLQIQKNFQKERDLNINKIQYMAVDLTLEIVD